MGGKALALHFACGGVEKRLGEKRRSGAGVRESIGRIVADQPKSFSGNSRVKDAKRPRVLCGAAQTLPTAWDATTHTCLVKFENKSEGVKVEVKY